MIYGFVIVILSIVILYLLCRLVLLKKAILRAGKELQDISLHLDENRVLKLEAPEKELERFLEIVNQNLTNIRTQRQEYQQKERILKEQVENISHDLRTPLTAVLGYLKMIDQEQMDAGDREYLEIAVRRSCTLQNLIAQFYELSRVTSDDFQMKLEPVDAFRSLKETCLEHYGLFEKEQMMLKLPHIERAVMIQGNAQALQRVFSNLLQNSIRYAKSELNIEVEQNAGEDTVKFIFANDIEAEQEVSEPERLFERFYMQEQSRHKGGTGLGLTISKGLVEHMNGSISAEYVGEASQRYLVITIQLRAGV